MKRSDLDQMFGPEDPLKIPGLTILRNEMIDFCLEIQVLMKKWFENGNQFMQFGLEIPELRPLLELGAKYGLHANQMIANRYSIGQGLIPHVDLERFEEHVLICNVKGTCRMQFFKDDVVESVFLDVGDVLILEGEARWEWKHGIPEQLVDFYHDFPIPRTERFSITLRRLSIEY